MRSGLGAANCTRHGLPAPRAAFSLDGFVRLNTAMNTVRGQALVAVCAFIPVNHDAGASDKCNHGRKRKQLLRTQPHGVPRHAAMLVEEILARAIAQAAEVTDHHHHQRKCGDPVLHSPTPTGMQAKHNRTVLL